MTTETTQQMAILTDVTRCIGCDQCVAACKRTHDTGKDRRWRWQKRIDDLSATRWTTVLAEPGHHYVRQQCRHCVDPACASACPVAALHKTPEGPVVYDADICMGCRYCMMACPYGIPRYTWSDPVPTVRKCVMCYEQIKSGELEQPACTAACPSKATIYGPRDALIAEAKQRIADHPERYIDRVWGEHEVGGTNVLYLSDIDLGFLGWQPDLGTTPLPERTAPAMSAVPPAFVGMGALMVGTWWVIERRMKRERERAQHDRPAASTEPPTADGDAAAGDKGE